jgi:hypothetical protein
MPTIDVRIESDDVLFTQDIYRDLVAAHPRRGVTVTALPAPDDSWVSKLRQRFIANVEEADTPQAAVAWRKAAAALGLHDHAAAPDPDATCESGEQAANDAIDALESTSGPAGEFAAWETRQFQEGVLRLLGMLVDSARKAAR